MTPRIHVGVGGWTFEPWRDETPEGFVFSLKAHRFTTHRKDMATAAEGVQRFVGSGIAALGDKLGPILWQFMPTKKFVPQEVDAFLTLLPRDVEGRPLRHVLDVRHDSFATEEYLELLARHGCTTVYTDAPRFPAIPHAKSELAYLRLMHSEADCPTGYAPDALGPWVRGAHEWVGMGPAREAYVFFINGAKERAPAAAMEFLKQIGRTAAAS